MEISKVDTPSVPIYDGTKPIIQQNLIIPHAAHGFAIGVEYIRDWFLKQFGDTITTPMEKRFFKTVWVNGKHVMDNYKLYGALDLTKKMKPMVAFTPEPDMAYDRDYLDQYRGNLQMYIRKFNHTGSFFRDFKNNIFLGMNVRDLKINFDIKCRVETRAQQLNLYRKIEMYCGVGATQYDFVSADFHIPKEIMINIANHAGFEFTIENGIFKVKDEVAFLKYLNSNSKYYISYKLRTMTGQNEYFMRVPGVYIHLDKQDKPSLGSGESRGMTQTNFDIDWTVEMIIKVPSFYVYGSAKEVYTDIPLNEDDTDKIGLWTYRVLDIPEQNKKGWNLLWSTTYEYDENELKQDEVKIDLSPLFTELYLKTMIEAHLELNMSPERFLSISVFNFYENATCEMDWKTEVLTVHHDPNSKIILACYIDQAYKNEQCAILQNAQKSRLS